MPFGCGTMLAMLAENLQIVKSKSGALRYIKLFDRDGNYLTDLPATGYSYHQEYTELHGGLARYSFDVYALHVEEVVE